MKSFFPMYRSFSSDKNIWNDVYFHNEYLLSALSPSGMVIDIGAHTGAFTCACLDGGARRIIAFEPDPESFALAMENIQDYLDCRELSASVEVHDSAVWRSDRQDMLRITHARFSELTQSYHQAAQTTLFNDKDTMPVHSVGLDNILRPLHEVALLKLDCEGAEWPILFTAAQLGKVRRLLLEVHSLAWKAYELGRIVPADIIAEFGHYTFDDLKAHLQSFGLLCVAEKIKWNFSNNPKFYFGLVVFEFQGNPKGRRKSLTDRLEWRPNNEEEVLVKQKRYKC